MEIIKTRTSDKLLLSALYSISAIPDVRDTIIIHFHGMAGDFYTNAFVQKMHEQYPNSGFSFMSVQTRGTDSVMQVLVGENEWVYYGNTYEIFEESVLDIEAWIRKALELGYKEIWLQGHSLAPTKLIYFVNNADIDLLERVKGLILISPSDIGGFSTHPDYVEKHRDLLKEATELVNSGNDLQILSGEKWGYKLSAKTYLNMFGENSNTDIFNYKKTAWPQVKGIKLPVIAFTGTEDSGIVPIMEAQEAMKKIENEFSSSINAIGVVLGDATHSFSGYEDVLCKNIVEFVNDN